MAFVTDSNRPQPLWKPPAPACPSASGAASEVRSFECIPGGGVALAAVLHHLAHASVGRGRASARHTSHATLNLEQLLRPHSGADRTGSQKQALCRACDKGGLNWAMSIHCPEPEGGWGAGAHRELWCIAVFRPPPPLSLVALPGAGVPHRARPPAPHHTAGQSPAAAPHSVDGAATGPGGFWFRCPGRTTLGGLLPESWKGGALLKARGFGSVFGSAEDTLVLHVGCFSIWIEVRPSNDIVPNTFL